MKWQAILDNKMNVKYSTFSFLQVRSHVFLYGTRPQLTPNKNTRLVGLSLIYFKITMKDNYKLFLTL